MPETEKVNLKHVGQDILIVLLTVLGYFTAVIIILLIGSALAHEIFDMPFPQSENDLPIGFTIAVSACAFGIFTKAFYNMFKRRPKEEMRHFLLVLLAVMLVSIAQTVAMEYEMSWRAASCMSNILAFLASYGLFKRFGGL